jgi:hypothetical protein
MNDKSLFKLLGVLLLLPIGFSYFSEEKFRYPCQDPANWETAQCQKPLCDVTRTCPEHIFKGQRDPRLGPPTEQNQSTAAKPASTPVGGCNVK